MRMVKADQAHEITTGSTKVRVGVMDTGVQADHPDIHPNFDYQLSRNFVTDIPSFDGPCEHPSCVDPIGEDDGGHGTHVAGTIAASLNGFGVSGVAPSVDIVEVRAGQDSGFFFAGPTLDALTYSGDAGLDVVNMSFYVDPWLYNCVGGAPEDTPAQANDQDVIIDSMTRALDYAHSKGVTMFAAAGNGHTDMANPGTDPPARTSASRSTRARSTTTRATTCRPRARTCLASPRSARRPPSPTTPTGRPSRSRARSRSRRRVAGSVTASAPRRSGRRRT